MKGQYEKLEYEIFLYIPYKLNLAEQYIESISFKTDMQIILQTIKSIMR